MHSPPLQAGYFTSRTLIPNICQRREAFSSPPLSVINAFHSGASFVAGGAKWRAKRRRLNKLRPLIYCWRRKVVLASIWTANQGSPCPHHARQNATVKRNPEERDWDDVARRRISDISLRTITYFPHSCCHHEKCVAFMDMSVCPCPPPPRPVPSCSGYVAPN